MPHRRRSSTSRPQVDGVTLITHADGRPELFDLCERWVSRQTWSASGRPLQWLVVYSGGRSFQPMLGQEVIRISRRKTVTQSDVLRATIPRVCNSRVLLIDVEQWYGPEYVEFMTGHLEQADLVGGTESLRVVPDSNNCLDGVRQEFPLLHHSAIRASCLQQLVAARRHAGGSPEGALWTSPDLNAVRLPVLDQVVSYTGGAAR